MKAESKTIQLPRTILETGADKDIELECNLPDYLPGINRVIRTEANVLTDEVTLNGNKAEVRGKAVFSLLYESDYKGKLKNEKYSVDFTQRFDVGDLPAGECFANANCRCSYVSCKALNPRRFVLKCRADVRLELKAMQNACVVSAEDCSGAFFKSASHSFNCYRPPLQKDFKVEETFNLEGQAPIGEIIYAQLCFLPPEISVSEGSVLLHGSGVLKCLYEEEEGGVKLLERSFNTAFTVEDEAVGEDCKCLAEIVCSNCELMKEQDNYGEYRNLVLNGTAAVCVNIYEKRTLDLPTDMYFEEYDCAVKGESIDFEEVRIVGGSKLSLDKTLATNELSIGRCVDVNGELLVNEAEAEDDRIRIKGTCIVNALVEGENGFYTHDLSLPYEQELPACDLGKGCKIKAASVLCSISGEALEGGKLRIKAVGDVSGLAYKKNSFYAITEAELSKSEKAEEDKCIVIYYPGTGETAWEIGKRYRINPQSIMENNGDAFNKDGVVVAERAVLFI